MKKALSIILLAAVLIAQIAFVFCGLPIKSEAVENNKCGDDIIWFVDTLSGKLTLSGKGQTYEYEIGSAPWDKYADFITDISVSEGITHINEGTFNKLNKAVRLTLPSTLEEIHTSAGMESLEILELADNRNICFVNDSFSSKSTWYKSVREGSLIYFGSLLQGVKGTLPDNSTVEIADGTTHIRKNAFSGQSGAVDFIFPDSLRYIGINAFKDTAWYASQPDGLIYAGSVLLEYKGSIPDSDVNSVVLKDDIKGIADFAFRAQSLRSITIPATVEEIGKSAFINNAWLEKVVFEDSSKLQRIDSYAFNGCNRLKEFEIPAGVAFIGAEALSRTGFDYLYIPESVLTLDGAFGEKGVVERFEVSPDNPNYCSDIDGVIFSKDKTVLYDVPGSLNKEEYNVPSCVHYIADKAFAGSMIDKVTFNKELKSTGCYVFHYSYTTKLDIGKGIQTIPESFLGYAHGLTELVIPKTVKYIEYGAFFENKLKDILFLSKDVTFGGRVLKRYTDTVFHCYSDSTAHNNAAEYGVQYILFDDEHFTFEIDYLLLKAEGIHRPYYTEESLSNLDAVLDKIDLNAENLVQQQIDDWCIELETAIDGLELQSADYSELESLIEQAEKIDRSLYTVESLESLDKALIEVEEDVTVDNQSQILVWTSNVKNAIEALEYLPADYSEVNAEVKKAQAVDARFYTESSMLVLNNVISAVDYTLDITEQKTVDGFADSIKKAIAALEYSSVVLRYDPCGVIVSATTKQINPSTSLAVEMVDSSEHEGTNFAVGGSIKSLHFYDIKLVLENGVVQPSGTVNVKIKLADGVNPTKCKVYHVTEDIVNPLVRFASTIDGNYISFETDHFSEFAVIEVDTVVSSIKITSLPVKTEYNIGEPVDITGLNVVAYYSDGSVAATDDYKVSMVSTASLGIKTVTVYYTYGNITKTADFDINVSGSRCYVDIIENGNSVERVNKKLGLFDLYSKASVQLECVLKNAEGCTLRWSSDNSKVMVDTNGKVTCKGLFGAKKANITVQVIDAEGNLVAEDMVLVVFYKLSFQLSNSVSQAFEVFKRNIVLW